MAVGFGVLRLAPAVLWSMTMRELEAAIRGRIGPAALDGPPSRRELAAMLARFPDRDAMDDLDRMDARGGPSRPSGPYRP